MESGLVLLAGRYEGIDERVVERAVDLEIAIGDFVVSGGELPALLLIESIVRQLPGVLNDLASAVQCAGTQRSGGEGSMQGAVRR